MYRVMLNRASLPRLAAVLFALLLSVLAVSARAQVQVPPLRSPVTDLTQTLTPAQIGSLEQRLREYEASKGTQIGVLIVPTTQPETIEEYSIRVAEQWKLGRAGVDDGVLLLVAKNDRAVRIEVGRGLEGALPDVIANRIVEQVIVPRFRAGDFVGGIEAALDRIIAVLAGEPLPEPPRRESRERSSNGFGTVVPLLLMIVFAVGSILRRTLGALGGATLTAGVAALLAWILTYAIPIAIGAAFIAFLFTVFNDNDGGSGGGWTNRRGGRGWGSGRTGGFGGFGGGGGRGGGGFGGGWSGGGGSFGGGGASGRW